MPPSAELIKVLTLPGPCSRQGFQPPEWRAVLAVKFTCEELFYETDCL